VLLLLLLVAIAPPDELLTAAPGQFNAISFWSFTQAVVEYVVDTHPWEQPEFVQLLIVNDVEEHAVVVWYWYCPAVQVFGSVL